MIVNNENFPIYSGSFIVCTIDSSLIWCSDIEHYPSKSDRFLVRTAFLEIYNEKISDLMVGTTFLQEIRAQFT